MSGIQELKINRGLVLIRIVGRLTGIDQDGLKRMPSKVCSVCGEEKELSEFYKDSTHYDGHHSECKCCHNIKCKKWREDNKELKAKNDRDYQIRNREKISNYQKEYRIRNKEKSKEYHKEYQRVNRVDLAEKQKAHRDSIKPEISKYSRMYYSRNRIRIINYVCNYVKTPRGKINVTRYRHNRRSNSKQSENTLTLEQWEKILSNQGNKCAMCGKRFCNSRPPTKDHIVPVSKGGGFTFENIQALCRNCNSSKQDNLDYSNVVTWINIST